MPEYQISQPPISGKKDLQTAHSRTCRKGGVDNEGTVLTAETVQKALWSTRRETRPTTRIMLKACTHCAKHVQAALPCMAIVIVHSKMALRVQTDEGENCCELERPCSICIEQDISLAIALINETGVVSGLPSPPSGSSA